MEEATYKQMTTEHLGSDATDADLEEFVAACHEYQRQYPQVSDMEATDYVWNHGDFAVRVDELVR